MSTLQKRSQRGLQIAASIFSLPVVLASLGIAGGVIGFRQAGLLERVELWAYDQLIQLRPDRGPDPRLLIVAITEEDIQSLEKWPMSDEVMSQAIDILDRYQPLAIGLDLYRDLPTNPGHEALAAQLEARDRIVAVCKVGDAQGKGEVPPPQALDEWQSSNDRRVGFSDTVVDTDGIVRRSLLAISPSENECRTPLSLSLQLAFQYLEARGIQPADTETLQLQQTVFPRLEATAGSYQTADAQGYQILLDYRSANRVANRVTLSDVLNNRLQPDWVKDRIVTIGVDASSIDDSFYTPFSATQADNRKMAGVAVHAQITSQILSAVLDNQPLIWFWADWQELTWIVVWAFAGGLVARALRRPLYFSVGLASCLVLLSGIGISTFVSSSGWIPVIPPAIALVLSGVSVTAHKTYKTLREQQALIRRAEDQKENLALLQTLMQDPNRIAPSPITRSQETEISSANIPQPATISTDQHERTELPDDITGALGVNPSSEEFPPDPRTLPEFRLAGRYRVIEPLALGGFGQTFLAEDTQRPGNPTCVVKHLMPARTDAQFLKVARRLFNNEAEILEQLGKHNQIPQLLAYFEENEEFYLVEEYIEGHPLNDELPIDKRLTEFRTIELLKGILPVMAFIHKHHVIHRDIKPGNIIRRKQDSRLVLIDFGAVKQIRPNAPREQEGFTVAIGTKGYAPPEQFVGQPRLSSDIYALGMIGIQAITGIMPAELPQDPETGNILWRDFTTTSDEFADVLNRMICYHFSERYQSASEALKALKALPELPPTASPVPKDVAPIKPIQDKPPSKSGKMGVDD